MALYLGIIDEYFLWRAGKLWRSSFGAGSRLEVDALIGGRWIDVFHEPDRDGAKKISPAASKTFAGQRWKPARSAVEPCSGFANAQADRERTAPMSGRLRGHYREQEGEDPCVAGALPF